MSRVAEILIAQANAQADAARQRGAIWGNAFGNIGQSVAALPGQMQQQKHQDALMLLEQAREARAKGEEQRANALFQAAERQHQNTKQIHATIFANPEQPDIKAGIAKAMELGEDPADVYALGEKIAPKLTEHDPTKSLRDAAGNIVVPAEPKPVTYGAPQPMMIGGKRVLVRTGSDDKLYDMQGKPVAGVDITPDEPPITEYQRRMLEKPTAANTEWVTRGGKPVEITKGTAQAGDVPYSTAAAGGKPATPAEKQVLAFYNRGKEAVDTLTRTPESGGDSLEWRIAKQGTLGQLQGQYGWNITQTKDQQAYRQAQRAFTEARLRKESGAAINDAEYEKDARTYFVQPGDDKATIAQKEKSRQVVLNGLKFGSGKAYEEYYGEPNTAGGKPADVSGKPALDAAWAALPHPPPGSPAGTTTPEEIAFWQAHPEYVGALPPKQGKQNGPKPAGADPLGLFKNRWLMIQF